MDSPVRTAKHMRYSVYWFRISTISSRVPHLQGLLNGKLGESADL